MTSLIADVVSEVFDLAVRIISAAVGIVIAVAVFLMHNTIVLPIAVSLIIGLMIYELLKAASCMEFYPASAAAIVYGMSSPLVFGTKAADYSICYQLALVFIVFLTYIMKHKTIKFEQITFILAVSLLVPSAMTCTIKTEAISENHGLALMILGLCGAWIADSVALGFVAGFTGKEIEDGVKAMGVKTDFIQLKNGLSRINVKIKAEQETEINGQGPDIKKDELQQMFDKLDKLQSGDCLILAGTIPASLPSDIYEQIMEKLMNRNIDIVVDATKDLLLNVLKFHPFLIKPNNHELGEMFGVVLKSDDEIVEYAKKLQIMGARNVLISMAGDGAILITETGEVHKIGVPKGTVVNSVGAGDSMVAGFTASFLKDHDYMEALKRGTATGSATAFSEGLATADKVEELYKQL